MGAKTFCLKLAKKVLQAKLAYRGLMKPRPFNINIAATYLCNSRCRMCNVWKIYEADSKKFQDELTARDYSDFFQSLSSDILWLTLTGGEPFLKRDLVELVDVANRQLKNLHIIGLATNGLDPKLILKKTQEIIEISPNKSISLGVSLDGAPLVHNYMRRRQDAWDNATRTFMNLKELAESHQNLLPHLSYTITSYNVGKFEEFYRNAKDYLSIELNDISVAIEHSGLLYQNVNLTSDAKTLCKSNLEAKAVKDVEFILQNNDGSSKSNGLINVSKQMFYTFYLTKIEEHIKNPSNMIIPCSALFASFFMNPYGDVYPCIIWDKKIGNIRKEHFDDIWYSSLTKNIRKMIKRKRCPNCWTPCEAQPSFMMALPWSLISAISHRLSASHGR